MLAGHIVGVVRVSAVMTILTIVADAGINIDVTGLWIENVLTSHKAVTEGAADIAIVELNTVFNRRTWVLTLVNVWELFPLTVFTSGFSGRGNSPSLPGSGCVHSSSGGPSQHSSRSKR